jgi:cyclic pyranopterin phosphate synthase
LSELTHLDNNGEARMVDVGEKTASERRAVAEGRIRLNQTAFDALNRGELKKGDALATARIAGIMAGKRTSELVPLCHPIALTHLELHLTLEPANQAVRCTAEAATTERTGVEMEALTGVQIALLTVYDMCKSLDRAMRIEDVALVAKSGGQSGDYQRDTQHE